MAVEISTHSHAVIDDDRRFVVDLDTKKITPAASEVTIAQHSIDSERLTFEIPTIIVEGHDMTKCNRVEIHFRNVEAKTGQESIGIYQVKEKDLLVENETLVISWLVGKDATVYAGGLVFSIHYICIEGGKVVYDFPTITYTGLSVGETTWYSEAISKKYPDIIANHEDRITALERGSGMTQTEKNLILTLFRNAAYTSGNMNAVLTQLESIWSGSGGGTEPDVPVVPDEPDEPGVPETGVSNETEWHSGVDYTFTPIADEYPDKSTGEIKAYSVWTRTPYLYCAGASTLRITALANTTALERGATDNVFYDSDKNYVSSFDYSDVGSKEPGYYIDIPIPENVAYFILSGVSGRFPNQSSTYPDGQIKITPYE